MAQLRWMDHPSWMGTFWMDEWEHDEKLRCSDGSKLDGEMDGSALDIAYAAVPELADKRHRNA